MMSEKKCNPNNKKYKENPNDYECNTKTGRWIKKKKVKKETNLDNDEYVFHPDTGRRYKKNGKKGKQIMEMMNQVKFTNVEKIPEDILNLSEKMSIKEIREIIQKHGMNIKGKTKKELIERVKSVYKRKQKKQNSKPLEQQDSFENMLVQKPKKKSIDENVSITQDKKSSSSNFFSTKKSSTGSSDGFFTPREKVVYAPSKNRSLFPFVRTTTSTSTRSASKQSDEKDVSLPSAFIPSDKSQSSKSKKSSSVGSLSRKKKSTKSESDGEFCPCESKYTDFKKSDWNIVKMPGDNHCGFHSIIYGLRSKTNSHPSIDLTKDTKDLILELRYLLIQHYRYTNKEKYKEILTDILYWLEDSDIKVLADYLNICFCIYDKQSDKIRKKNKAFDISVFTHVRPDNESDCTVCIYLYQTENHYDIMFPKNDTRNDVVLPRTLVITDNDLVEFLLEKDFQVSNSTSDFSKSKSSSQQSSAKSKSSSQQLFAKSKSSSQQSSEKSKSSSQQLSAKSKSSTTNIPTPLTPKSSSQQQESEIAENAHLKVITNIKKLQTKEFVQYSHLDPKEVKKIIKGTIKMQSIPKWLL